MRILLKNITILPMTSPKEIIEKGYVVINGSLIQSVGKENRPPEIMKK